jgi:hypothetical protein
MINLFVIDISCNFLPYILFILKIFLFYYKYTFILKIFLFYYKYTFILKIFLFYYKYISKKKINRKLVGRGDKHILW